jgi:rhodanese-related sulfurtransferase
MNKKWLKRFRWIYIIDTFIKIVVNRLRLGKWPVPEITPDELNEHIKSNKSPLLVYVLRIYGEEGLIPNTLTIPTPKLISYLDHLQSYKEKKIVTVCGGGGMSLVAADILIQAGFKDVKSLNGGMELWYKRGYPTIKP